MLGHVRMRANTWSDERGMTVLDALAAGTILAVGLVALSQLLLIAARAAGHAAQLTSASTLADQKLEEFRGFAWYLDAAGDQVSDARLTVSPPAALEHDTPGYVDYLDGGGNPVVVRGDGQPAGVAFVRRWSVTPVPARPADARVIQVRVMPLFSREPGGARPTRAGEAWAATVRSRRAE